MSEPKSDTYQALFFRNEACDGEVFEALCVAVDEGDEVEDFEAFENGNINFLTLGLQAFSYVFQVVALVFAFVFARRGRARKPKATQETIFFM